MFFKLEDRPISGDEVMSYLYHWMQANGCRDFIGFDPIIIRGNYVEYTSYGRRDWVKKAPTRSIMDRNGDIKTVKRKLMRIRVPFHPPST